MKRLLLLMLLPSVLFAQDYTTRTLYADSVYSIKWGNLPAIAASDSARASSKADSLVGFTKTGILRSADSVSERNYSNFLYASNYRQVFDSIWVRSYGNLPTIGATDSSRASHKTDSLVNFTKTGVLHSADSTSIRSYSNSLYLKNADSSTERTYSNSLYLKNADSTSERSYSNSLYLGLHGTADTSIASYWATNIRGNYLKPADSTTERTYSNSLYLKNADSTDKATRTYVSTIYESKSQVGTDTTSGRTYSNSLYLKNADSTTERTYSNSLYLKNADSTDRATRTYVSTIYESKSQIGTDTTKERTYSNSIYLKNADSTTERTYSSSIYLKNADSTTLKNSLLKNADSVSVRNQSNALYLKNADSTTERTYSDSLYLKNADSTTERTYANSIYLKNADSTTLKNSILKNADSTTERNYSNSLYLKNADSTTERGYSNSLYSPMAGNSGLVTVGSLTNSLLFGTDNSYNIGGASDNRPRDIHVGEDLDVVRNISSHGTLFLYGNMTWQTYTGDIGNGAGFNDPRDMYLTRNLRTDSIYARAYGNVARTTPAYTASTTTFLRADSTWQTVTATADSCRASHIADTSKVSYWATDIRGGSYIRPADSTTERTYSNSLYLKNADSTTERTYSNSLYLKNADSTTERTYSSSIYLKNADSTTLKNALLKNIDSTTERTYSNSLYLKNIDSTTERTYSNSLYLKNADSTTERTYSNSIYLKNADSTTLKNSLLKNADSTSIRNQSNALYESKTQMGTDTTSLRNYSASLYVAKTTSHPYFGCGADSANTTTTDKFPMGVSPIAVTVDSIHIICSYTTTPAFTPTISYGTDINATGTSLGSYSSVTTSHVTSAVGYGTSIPAGNDVWVVWGTISTKPHRWAILIWAH